MILAIESSCDDSSIALYDPKRLELVYHKKISQELEHSKYGGVVPELASRLHTEALPALLEGISHRLYEIRAVAVTNTPGLSVSLLAGVSMAKAASLALNVPLIGVNHLIGHIYSLFLSDKPRFDMGVLLVSGGHTMIIDVDKNGVLSTLATTSDDSFGESFDKVAKMLGFGYPGGAFIQNAVQNSTNPDRFKFSIPLLHDKRLEYSFSGLKNQVRLAIESIKNENGKLSEADISDISYAFEKAACAHIMDKLERIYNLRRYKSFGVVGGASANLTLRSKLSALCDKFNSELLLAPLEFCSDNAAMIARAASAKYDRSDFTDISALDVVPRSDINGANM